MTRTTTAERTGEEILDIPLDETIVRILVESDLSENQRLKIFTNFYDIRLNITPRERAHLKKEMTKHLNIGGVEDVYSFLQDARAAFINLQGNLKEAIRYANTGLELEKKLCSDSRTDYTDYVFIGTAAGLSLRKAVDFGYKIVLNEDLDNLVKKLMGLTQDRNFKEYAYETYKNAKEVYGSDAIKYYLPALLILENKPEVLRRVSAEEIENNISSIVGFSRAYKRYRSFFYQIVDSLFYSTLNDIGNNTIDHMNFARAAADISRVNCNMERWKKFVKESRHIGLPLEDAILLGNKLEYYAMDTGHYRGKPALSYLRQLVPENSWHIDSIEKVLRDLGISVANKYFIVDKPRFSYPVYNDKQGLFGDN